VPELPRKLKSDKGMVKLVSGSGIKIEAVISKYFYWNGRKADLVCTAKYSRPFRNQKNLSK
jgi:hypothetical protein